MKSLGVAIVLGVSISACATAPAPRWVRDFGYAPEEIHPIAIGEFGYPYVRARIEGADLELPFDTGNTTGVSVSAEMFDRLGLTPGGYADHRNSAGEIGARLRVSAPAHVSVLGRDLGPTPVYEVDHPGLPGMVGPTALGGSRFTLDYPARRLGVSEGSLPDSVTGFRPVPLVRSRRHPRLILVWGTIEGREVLIELDTGKSRTVVNPTLADELALARGPRGVAIQDLRIGGLSFEVPSAKEVDQTGIVPDLPEPILAGVGSDILSRFVWTVDYESKRLWIPVRE